MIAPLSSVHNSKCRQFTCGTRSSGLYQKNVSSHGMFRIPWALPLRGGNPVGETRFRGRSSGSDVMHGSHRAVARRAIVRLVAFWALDVLGGDSTAQAADREPSRQIERAEPKRDSRRRAAVKSSAASKATGARQKNAGSKGPISKSGMRGIAEGNEPARTQPHSPGAPADHPPVPPPTEEEKKQTWTEPEIIAALEDCVKVMAPILANIDIAKPVRTGECGAPAPVLLRRVGTSHSVEISPPALINCQMVVRLHAWIESTLQPAARDLLKAPVARLTNASGYVCRSRDGLATDRASEHAFANAIDITSLVTADGKTIEVLTHWGPTARDAPSGSSQSAPTQEIDGPDQKKTGKAEVSSVGPAPKIGAPSRRAGPIPLWLGATWVEEIRGVFPMAPLTGQQPFPPRASFCGGSTRARAGSSAPCSGQKPMKRTAIICISTWRRAVAEHSANRDWQAISDRQRACCRARTLVAAAEDEHGSTDRCDVT
jgi:hypothetical protein